MTGAQPRFAVLGEALIDLAGGDDDEPWLARPGGSPYNVAIGLARLGRRTAFVGRMSGDPLATILREHARRSGVDLSEVVAADEPTTIAVVHLRDGIATYQFGVRGTVDFQWTDAELAGRAGGADVLHFGSLASWTPPGAAALTRRVAALRATALVTYDPNVRPHLQPDRAAARRRVEDAVALAVVVKTSTDDLRWLYPDTPPEQAARGWLARGPDLVVVTAGSRGATAHTRAEQISCPARAVRVVDTVGAGDAFMAGLLDALAQRRLLSAAAISAAPVNTMRDVVGHAALVAALTCARPGANPPWRGELEDAAS